MVHRYTTNNSPFNPANDELYKRWREQKLESAPASLAEMVVEVDDPRYLSDSEIEAMRHCIGKTNMVIYAGNTGEDADKAIPHLLARQFGLQRLNHNWLADEDGITSLTVNDEGDHPTYIPYTNRPIHWHTDGYYNPLRQQVYGLLLHCVHSAASGGENALMDHEMAYIHLRDNAPAYLHALMAPDVLTIPAGTDMYGDPRDASVGPVFSIDENTGVLHMRYTARRHNIHWKDTLETGEAVRALETLLAGDSDFIYRGRLEPGMGLVSNNVLHDRAGFEDREGTPKRLLYRARYFDRIG